jgi:hypothetical protein
VVNAKTRAKTILSCLSLRLKRGRLDYRNFSGSGTIRASEEGPAAPFSAKPGSCPGGMVHD